MNGQISFTKGFLKIFCLIFSILGLATIYFYFSSFSANQRCNCEDVQSRSTKDIPGAILLDIDPAQLDNMTQDDHLLWKYIRNHHIVPPSKKNYNLEKTSPTTEPETQGQGRIAHKILKYMTGGFFVEAGAHNGEYGSTTIDLERNYNWTGMLIEGDPLIYPHLKRKHRRAWLSDACLSPTRNPQLVNFSHADNYDIASRVGSPTSATNKWTTFEVQCFPIYAILAAIHVKVVDYFSLDVEGLELKVLHSIPFDRLLIKVFSIEFHLLSADDKKALMRFMESKSYRLTTQTSIDFIYAHTSVLHNN